MTEAADQDLSALDVFLETQPSLRPMRAQLVRAARSSAPILLRGEAGTGRTTLARALSHASAQTSLVEADVGLIPASLFEGELFGYSRGAFTGAESSRQGLVARAHGGTLLLDRIEEIPAQLQPKLLRLLAENRFAPLGGKERDAQVRFLSIASNELAERLRNGSFREDLYYRLEVLSFALPSLRVRRGDIGPLIDAMLRDACVRYAKTNLVLSQGSREWMLAHSWPGNLRELGNTLERAVVMHENGELVTQKPRVLEQERPRSIAELEAEAIVGALRFTGGHQGRAAELLGVSRKTLWDKRRRYGIP